MFATIDVTPISSPTGASAYVSEVAGGATPFHERQLREVFAPLRETPFTQSRRKDKDQTAAFVAQQAEVRSEEVEEVAASELSADVVRIRDDRIALLARRYAGEGSVEDDARFHILTMRLRRLDRALIDTAHEVLSEKVATLEEAAGTIASIRAKYNLK